MNKLGKRIRAPYRAYGQSRPSVGEVGSHFNAIWEVFRDLILGGQRNNTSSVMRILRRHLYRISGGK